MLGFMDKDCSFQSLVFEGSINSSVVVACIDFFAKSLARPTVLVVDFGKTTSDDTQVGATITTNSAGNYLFSSLDPGDYYLVFDKANVMHYNATYGASYNMSTWKWAMKDTGPDDAKDSDVTGNGVATTDVTSTSKINLVSGENDMPWDAGITLIAIDLNGDGIHSVSRQDSKGTFDLCG